MKRREAERRDATKCVHAGEERHGTNAGLTTDVVLSAVFVMPQVNELRRIAEGKSDAYMYTRYANPTTRVVEQKIAALEGGEDCVVTASGMAAELITILATCSAGDEIVSMLDLYGGTLKLFENVLARFGVKTRLVPYQDLGRLSRFLTSRTKMVFLESPTNPTLRCADIAALAEAAHKRRALVVVDNTFATPILQKPLSLGADLVLHSGTKYLGGHSDVTAGAVVGSKQWIARAREAMKLSGGCLDANAAYLLLRGLKTLELRVERACANTVRIVDFLRAHSRVARVFYPGIAGNDGGEFAARQMRHPGMMVSFDLRGGGRAAEKFIDSLKLWYLATSLGGVESTVSYPLLSSHVGFSRERLAQLDVSAATVRLSVGIEDSTDLVADLEQALQKV